jgi:hypothetical protein
VCHANHVIRTGVACGELFGSTVAMFAIPGEFVPGLLEGDAVRRPNACQLLILGGQGFGQECFGLACGTGHANVCYFNGVCSGIFQFQATLVRFGFDRIDVFVVFHCALA